MKKTYRKCDTCKNEYRVTREAQSYCSPRCRRAAAYGRERFENETKGPRKRRLEASETLQATPLPGSFRNGHISSTKSVRCKAPDNWIYANNMAMAAEIDLEALEADRKRESKLWPTNLLGGAKRRNCKPVTKEDRAIILADEVPERRLPLQGYYPLKYYDDGYPRLPECLRRTSLKLVVNNPPRTQSKRKRLSVPAETRSRLPQVVESHADILLAIT